MSLVLRTREEESRSLAHGILMVTPDQAEEYLMHWRTRGSKNGIRRYQYEDGSLTPLGYIHYGVGQGNKKTKKAEKAKAKYEEAEIRKNKAQVKYDEAKLRNERKNTERSERNLERASNELDKATFKADKLKLKSNKLEKAAKRQEEKGERLIKKDQDREQIEAYKEVQEWNKKAEEQNNLNNSGEQDNRRIKQTEDVKKLAKDPSSFDSMSENDRKKAGDELLKYLDMNKKQIDYDIADYKEQYKDPWKRYREDTQASHEYDDYDKLQSWLTDRVYDKSGSWNAGYFDPKSKAAKVYPSVDKTMRDLWDREEKLEKSTGVTTKNYDKWKKVMRNDSIWQSLNEAYKKSESDLCGAILEDIGFNDTPENRFMIIDFAYID